MGKPPAARGRIVQALRHFGPMTGAEIREYLRMSKTTFWCAIQPLYTGTPKRLYISGWQSPEAGKRGRLKPVYCLGDAPDCEKPETDPNAAHRRYRERNRLLIRLRDNKRRGVQSNPYLQLIAPCQSAPKKQPSARG
jgi:hypothetical protein